MVPPSEGSFMNVYRLHCAHGLPLRRLIYECVPAAFLAALQGRGKVFPILVKGGTLNTRAQLVTPCLWLWELPCLVLLLHLLASFSKNIVHHLLIISLCSQKSAEDEEKARVGHGLTTGINPPIKLIHP